MKTPDVKIEEIYDIPETCKALGIDRRTLRRWTQSGSIASHIRKCDGRIVYYGKDILACHFGVL